MAGPKILSLFSGVGGLELAVQLAIPGARVAGYLEWDSFASAALMARMEESSLDLAPAFVGDIHELDGRELRGEVDIVCGGIPCQPYSLAGAQRGNEDDRALWPEFARVVYECEPSLVFIENVPAFVTSGEFRPLGEELCRLGFEIADPFFIGAGDVGAPHRRKRVFILAYRHGAGPEGQRSVRELVAGIGEAQRNDADGCDEELADATGNGRAQRSDGGWCRRNMEEPRKGGERVGDRGPAVADAEGLGRRRDEQERGSEGRASPGRSGEDRPVGQGRVPDAERDALRDESKRGRGPARAAEPGDAEPRDLGKASVADTGHDQQKKPKGDDSKRKQREAVGGRKQQPTGTGAGGTDSCRLHAQRDGGPEIAAENEGAHFGNFPPAPDDEDGWVEVLGRAPHLAPAIEPGFCVSLDGLPMVLDASRADQLRCAGNAVVVLQAAVALRQLVRWIGGDDDEATD